jgi:hypothetical protein
MPVLVQNFQPFRSADLIIENDLNKIPDNLKFKMAVCIQV